MLPEIKKIVLAIVVTGFVVQAASGSKRWNNSNSTFLLKTLGKFLENLV